VHVKIANHIINLTSGLASWFLYLPQGPYTGSAMPVPESTNTITTTSTITHPFNGPLFGTTRVSRDQKDKTIWILLKQEAVSGSGISWAVCKSAPHHFVFLQAGCPSCRPTNSVKALKAATSTITTSDIC